MSEVGLQGPPHLTWSSSAMECWRTFFTPRDGNAQQAETIHNLQYCILILCTIPSSCTDIFTSLKRIFGQAW